MQIFLTQNLYLQDNTRRFFLHFVRFLSPESLCTICLHLGLLLHASRHHELAFVGIFYNRFNNNVACMTTCLFMHNNADYTRLYNGQPSSLNLHNTYMRINQVALIFTTESLCIYIYIFIYIYRSCLSVLSYIHKLSYLGIIETHSNENPSVCPVSPGF